jgi:hypothetical protein
MASNPQPIGVDLSGKLVMGDPNSRAVLGALWCCGQLDGAHHEDLYDLLQLQETDQDFTVVCESFEYRNKSRPGLVLDSVEYIGIVKLWQQQTGRPVVFQTAHQGGKDKGNPVTADVLKKLGLYFPGWPHAMDASAHLVNYLLRFNTDWRRRILEALRP